MLTCSITINNKLGLHARAAAKFVNLASNYQSTIEVVYNQQKVNGKSIMGLMMLAASRGANLELFISGPDEQQALIKLINLINNKFDESE